MSQALIFVKISQINAILKYNRHKFAIKLPAILSPLSNDSQIMYIMRLANSNVPTQLGWDTHTRKEESVNFNV